MRGRQSVNIFKKLGFVVIRDDKIIITDLGKIFLKDKFDLGEIFLKIFLKWQINYKLKDGYNIKPFIGVLHLINQVNKETQKNGEEPKGISKEEFCLFCPTLINFKDIKKYAKKIVKLRTEQNGKNTKEKKKIFDDYRKVFVKSFLESSNPKEIKKLRENLKDYGDNAIRYFRLTRLLYIRGNGFYIDLEPRRETEIKNILELDNGELKKFDSKEEYLNFISNILEPKFPWESKKESLKIIFQLKEEIKNYENKLNISSKKINNEHDNNEELKKYISELRGYRKSLQDKKNYKKSQDIKYINQYTKDLKNIFKFDNRPILLEKLSSLGLSALNDALKIKPNYPVGDDNEPTFTAPANIPDIECYYKSFNVICEVTMLTSRDQWYNEGQPVMRHLREFEKKFEIPSYCIFIAPKIHRDTLNTFWNAIKYEYEGKKQKIIPLTIDDFIKLLKIVIKLKKQKIFLGHKNIKNLYDTIITISK